MSISSFGKVIRVSAALAGAGVAIKGVQLSIDWEDTIYDVKKYCGMISKSKNKPKIVVLGTGWAALSFIQHLDKDEVDLKIISPRSFFFYTPLLAGTSTGTVSYHSIMEPIRWYCGGTDNDGAKASYLQAECNDVDVKTKTLSCSLPSGSLVSIPYDHLIVAVGAEPATFGIPGVHEHAIFMKEIEDSMAVQKKIFQNLETASSMIDTNDSNKDEIDKLLNWVVIGGGPTGVELTAELTDFIQQDLKKYFPDVAHRVKLTLVEATGRLLSVFDEKMSAYARNTLSDRGAKVLTDTMVTAITTDCVNVKVKDTITGDLSAQKLPHGMVVWAGGIATRPITRKIASTIGTTVQSSRWGLLVDNKFRVTGVADGSVWAIGDCAVSGCGPTAQAAYQQGIFLGRLFRDTQLDKEKVATSAGFTYQSKGALAYVGGSKGVAELKSLLWDHYPTKGGQMSVEGSWAFAIWRSLYFSKLMSGRNQAQVGFDWVKTSLFGRDISSPFTLKPSDSQAQPNPAVGTAAAVAAAVANANRS